ncbi:MAG: pentapeptide repeat-containing protein [Myxococcota bacterium]
MSGLDPQLIARLTGAPLSAEAWAALVARHQRFIRDTRPGASQRWQVLDVSGLPLALWPGATEDQLNLKFGNLTGLTLDDARLIAAAMPGVLAEHVSFRRANLRLALLTDARLDGANFEGAHLDLADFSRSSLRGACLRGVSGTETDFERCDLRGADFTGAELIRPKLDGALLDGVVGLHGANT